MGRFLVLGGTVFLSRAVAAAALAGGHEVVCASRGTSGSPPAGAELVRVDRSTPGALEPLRGERFDAVLDMARMSVAWVREAVDVLGATGAHWTYVSSISVYADHTRTDHPRADHLPAGHAPADHPPAGHAPPGHVPADQARADLPPPGRGTGEAVLAPRHEPTDDPQHYGAVKVASEDVVRASVGDRALIVRAGLICGPGDVSDRFGYWPARFARGGPAVVPDDPGHPAQFVDVRDLAEWIVRGAEQRLTGTFDAAGPRRLLDDVLAEVAAAVGVPDLTLVAVPASDLVAAEVQSWSGPRSLPLWLPESHWGMTDRDTTQAAAAGLHTRSVGDTARTALAYERALGLDRARKAGLTAADEAEVLSQMPAVD